MKFGKEIVQVKEQEYWLRVDASGKPISDEVKKVDVIVKEIPRTGFAITYLSTIVQMIELVGNSETVREISTGCNCSLQTVNDTLKILENAGIIARKTGTVMLSPKLIHKGNAQKERFLMTKFFAIKDSESADLEIIK